MKIPDYIVKTYYLTKSLCHFSGIYLLPTNNALPCRCEGAELDADSDGAADPDDEAGGGHGVAPHLPPALAPAAALPPAALRVLPRLLLRPPAPALPAAASLPAGQGWGWRGPGPGARLPRLLPGAAAAVPVQLRPQPRPQPGPGLPVRALQLPLQRGQGHRAHHRHR